jgi:hypothetical protein
MFGLGFASCFGSAFCATDSFFGGGFGVLKGFGSGAAGAGRATIGGA